MLEFAGAARHAYHIRPLPGGPAPIPRTRTHPIQQSFRQRSIGQALRINASGSDFFHAPKHAPLSLDKPPGRHLRSVRRNRMRVGYRAWRVFFVTIVPFFVSIMFVLRKERGTLHRGKGDLHRSSGMRGRCWIYVCNRWKEGLGGRMEGRVEVVFPTYTLMLSVS